jgi:preprotein translocase subunit SecD
MQVQGTNSQDEAQKIWDQLEAEERGNAQPQDFAEQPTDQASETESTNQAPAENHNADLADAPKAGDAAAPSGDQVLLDKISGLETMLSQVTQRLRNAEGHIGGLGSQLKQQLQTAQQVSSRGGDAPTANEIRDAQRNPEAMARLKTDYPEFAEAMESALNERLSSLEQRIAQQQQPQPSVTADEIQRLRSEMAVEVRHPGWQDRVRTTEFMGWLQRQPREVQMLAASASPQDAVRLLDLHDDAMKSASNQRTQRLNSAAAIPSGRAGANMRQKAVEDMSPEEYWRYLDEIDRQKR